MIRGMETDYIRLAQAIICRGLHDAEFGTPRSKAKARHWLIYEPNEYRELLLGTTNLHQDDLVRFVKELEDVETNSG